MYFDDIKNFMDEILGSPCLQQEDPFDWKMSPSTNCDGDHESEDYGLDHTRCQSVFSYQHMGVKKASLFPCFELV